MKYAHVYVLFLVLVIHNSCGQNPTNPPQDNTRTHRSGLSESQLKEAATSKVPMSMVRNIRQASNGDILIASYIGVYRYDGKSFTNLTSTIQWPTFWDVLEDRKGNLWFASQDSGVYFYNGKSLSDGQAGFQHFTKKDGLGINSAMHIYEDRAGNIWFGASRYDARLNDEAGQGKSLPDGQAGFRNYTTKDGFPSNNIRLLLEDQTGKLWFGAQGENMFVYDARLNGEVGQGKTFTVLKNKDGKAFNNVWSIIEDKNGNIWFGASTIEDKRGDKSFVSQGLWRYDGTTFTKVSQRGAYAIIQDKKGNIWTTGEVSPNMWALSRYDANTLYDKTPTVTEIKSGGPMDFLALLEAEDGSIWFGSIGGVHRYDGNSFTDFKSAAGK